MARAPPRCPALGPRGELPPLARTGHRRGGGAIRNGIALTFDDGPGGVTGPLLDLLRDHETRATFFVLGRSIAGREHVLRRTAAEGHEIGNHLYSHRHPNELADDEIRDELARTGAAIEDVVARRPRLVRPPYGEDAARIARVASELGLGPTVLWTVDPGDWEEPPAAEIVSRTLDGVRPGAIVELHDGFTLPPPNADRQPTVEAVAELLPALTGRGYRCVTVSQLLAE